jgi:hypothetical protein
MMFNPFPPRSAFNLRPAGRALSSMPRKPQALQRILEADPALRSWTERHRREVALTGILRRHLPRPLADRVRVVDAQGTELVVAADAGAIAAVIRQRGPDLVAALTREGFEFSGIRLRVQVGTSSEQGTKRPTKPLDSDSLRPLTRLARELPVGELKTALARLLRRAR